jgi:hypothetical protein
MNVNCREYQHQITLLLYEELPEGMRPELEAHLRECTNCKDAYESDTETHPDRPALKDTLAATTYYSNPERRLYGK